jgi:hypothetical protein
MPARDRSLYGGSFQRRRRKLIAWAKSNPHLARCWRCQEPLATCGPNRNGKNKNGTEATWHADHPNHDPGDVLVLSCSACNTSEGAAHGNARRPRKPKGRRP